MSRNFGRVIAGKEFLKPRKWQEWAVDDYIQGEFVGELDKDKYKKPIYGIRVDGVADAKICFKDEKAHTGKKDGVVPLFPNGGLLMQLSKASIGDFVKITYSGKAKIKKGEWAGEMAHSVTVEIDGYSNEEESEEEGLDNLLGG